MAVEPLPDLDSELLISAFDGMVVSIPSSRASASTPAPAKEDDIPDQHVEMVPAPAESLFIEYESHQVFLDLFSFLISFKNKFPI